MGTVIMGAVDELVGRAGICGGRFEREDPGYGADGVPSAGCTA